MAVLAARQRQMFLADALAAGGPALVGGHARVLEVELDRRSQSHSRAGVCRSASTARSGARCRQSLGSRCAASAISRAPVPTVAWAARACTGARSVRRPRAAARARCRASACPRSHGPTEQARGAALTCFCSVRGFMKFRCTYFTPDSTFPSSPGCTAASDRSLSRSVRGLRLRRKPPRELQTLDRAQHGLCQPAALKTSNKNFPIVPTTRKKVPRPSA